MSWKARVTVLALLGFVLGGTPVPGRGSPPLPGRPSAGRLPSPHARVTPSPSRRTSDSPGFWRTFTQARSALIHPRAVLSLATLNALLARGRVLSCGPTTRKLRYVALTLDDGPSADTLRTLRILRRTGARATFFVVGRQAEKPSLRPLVSLMLIEGHQVENHTYSHELGAASGTACFARASPRHQVSEIRRTDRILPHPTHFLRVPGGLFPGDSVAQTVDVARMMRKVVVNWDVAGDTPGPAHIHRGRIDGLTPRDMLHRYLSQVQPGSIVLMHPEHASDAPYTLQILEPFIRRLQAKGYVLVTLDELMMAGVTRQPVAGFRRRR